MQDNDIVLWLYADGDILLFTARILFMIFALQFITGMAWILRGGADVCR